MKIEHIIARELYNAQGWPTIQCEIILDTGDYVTAMVPSGNSVGRHEASEMRDGGVRLFGMGIQNSIDIIKDIIEPELIGLEPKAFELDLKLIELDGTADKSRLGANTMLAVSEALYRAEAIMHDMELYELFAALYEADTVAMPLPMLNVINGGRHATNNLQIQEFMIVPVGTTSFRKAFEMGVMVYHELGTVLRKKGMSLAVGYEGGYASQFKDDFEALDILKEVVDRVNDSSPVTCMIALDMAVSSWSQYQKGLYAWQNKLHTTEEMVQFYKELVEKYSIYSLEDPLGQDDWEGWQLLTKELGSQVQVVGDDLFVTDPLRLVQGIELGAATGAIIKPNQIGTVSETLQAIAICKNNGLNPIISHRSADTEDTFIADLAVGTSAGQIKAGAPCRSERLAKYNRLLVIEDTLTLIAERS